MLGGSPVNVALSNPATSAIRAAGRWAFTNASGLCRGQKNADKHKRNAPSPKTWHLNSIGVPSCGSWFLLPACILLLMNSNRETKQVGTFPSRADRPAIEVNANSTKSLKSSCCSVVGQIGLMCDTAKDWETAPSRPKSWSSLRLFDFPGTSTRHDLRSKSAAA